MASYIGVDWAAGRWVVVIVNENGANVHTEPSFLNIWHEHGTESDVKSILVDVPIGLPENDHERACDVKAKEKLGSRGSTVFSIPSREVVESRDYCDARQANGGSLGSQSWWLFPQIREVDVFLQEHENARDKVYESHPELCFWELADEDTTSKFSEAGRKERLQILERDTLIHDEVSDLVDRNGNGAKWHDRISKNRIDDVIDAAILAFTAKSNRLGPRNGERDYPALRANQPTTDSKIGITPEIVLPP